MGSVIPEQVPYAALKSWAIKNNNNTNKKNNKVKAHRMYMWVCLDICS